MVALCTIIKGLQVRISKLRCTSVPEDCFYLGKQYRPCIVWHFVFIFTACQSTCLGVPSKQRDITIALDDPLYILRGNRLGFALCGISHLGLHLPFYPNSKN